VKRPATPARVRAHAAVEAGGRGDEVHRQVVGKPPEDRVGLAVAVRGGGQVLVQAGDGQPDGPDQFLRVALAAHGVLPLERGQFLQLAQRLRLFRLVGVLVAQDGLPFLLLGPDAAGDLQVVRGMAAFLGHGRGVEGYGLAGGLVHDAGEAKLPAVDVRDLGHEINGVDRFL